MLIYFQFISQASINKKYLAFIFFQLKNIVKKMMIQNLSEKVIHPRKNRIWNVLWYYDLLKKIIAFPVKLIESVQ